MRDNVAHVPVFMLLGVFVAVAGIALCSVLVRSPPPAPLGVSKEIELRGLPEQMIEGETVELSLRVLDDRGQVVPRPMVKWTIESDAPLLDHTDAGLPEERDGGAAPESSTFLGEVIRFEGLHRLPFVARREGDITVVARSDALEQRRKVSIVPPILGEWIRTSPPLAGMRVRIERTANGLTSTIVQAPDEGGPNVADAIERQHFPKPWAETAAKCARAAARPGVVIADSLRRQKDGTWAGRSLGLRFFWRGQCDEGPPEWANAKVTAELPETLIVEVPFHPKQIWTRSKAPDASSFELRVGASADAGAAPKAQDRVPKCNVEVHDTGEPLEYFPGYLAVVRAIADRARNDEERGSVATTEEEAREGITSQGEPPWTVMQPFMYSSYFTRYFILPRSYGGVLLGTTRTGYGPDPGSRPMYSTDLAVVHGIVHVSTHISLSSEMSVPPPCDGCGIQDSLYDATTGMELASVLRPSHTNFDDTPFILEIDGKSARVEAPGCRTRIDLRPLVH